MTTSNASRIQKLRESLKEHELDGILISQPDNMYYLSGFKGADSWCLISDNKNLLAVDFRYIEQAKTEAPEFEHVLIKGDISNWLPSIISDLNIRQIGIESDYITVAVFQRLQNAFQAHNEIKIAPVLHIVESLRSFKNAQEINDIEKATVLTDKALEFSLTILKPGITEIQIAWQLEKYLRDNGSEQLPFDIIVASGPHSAWPHARPTERIINKNEPITIDIGAKINGYCCDISRTFCIGSGNSMYNKIYDIVLAAQLSACSIIKAGMTGQEADLTARTIINETGHGLEFGHGLGHGIGLAVHELPRLGTNSTDILKNGMVFTIEPGIYIEGWGGIRIEDSVTIQNDKISVISKAIKQSNI